MFCPWYRFELYKRYLGELLVRDSEAGVILTDSRDVLIQSDPFKEPLVQRLINEVSQLLPAWADAWALLSSTRAIW
jgi:hypothetical protein